MPCPGPTARRHHRQLARVATAARGAPGAGVPRAAPGIRGAANSHGPGRPRTALAARGPSTADDPRAAPGIRDTADDPRATHGIRGAPDPRGPGDPRATPAAHGPSTAADLRATHRIPGTACPRGPGDPRATPASVAGSPRAAHAPRATHGPRATPAGVPRNPGSAPDPPPSPYRSCHPCAAAGSAYASYAGGGTACGRYTFGGPWGSPPVAPSAYSNGLDMAAHSRDQRCWWGSVRRYPPKPPRLTWRKTRPVTRYRAVSSQTCR
ncbi:hypothetical protein GCM10010383_17920 [Streptomyces lomondensis]|uniref:Uncharacterized protein n=1 Tax=Streptomyces lomondensis TaxID=68229 RepID=A0ABQ2X0D2_9ACTN|nr:hypothetical protein GCM10010383_17920 [Streptomyces lomondensis]